MRLSDARLRQRATKLIYPNHRLFPLAHRRRGPRSLEPIVRCHPTKLQPCLSELILLHLPQHRQVCPLAGCNAKIQGHARSLETLHRDPKANGRFRMRHRHSATAIPSEVILIRPTKEACRGATETRTARIPRPARRPIPHTNPRRPHGN